MLLVIQHAWEGGPGESNAEPVNLATCRAHHAWKRQARVKLSHFDQFNLVLALVIDLLL